jgi:hypothetical protein
LVYLLYKMDLQYVAAAALRVLEKGLEHQFKYLIFRPTFILCMKENVKRFTPLQNVLHKKHIVTRFFSGVTIFGKNLLQSIFARGII